MSIVENIILLEYYGKYYIIRILWKIIMSIVENIILLEYYGKYYIIRIL